MNINIFSVGKTSDDWVKKALQEYLKRFPKEYQLRFIENPLAVRQKSSNITIVKQKETAALFKAIPAKSLIVALDERGKEWSTVDLANNCKKWQIDFQAISFLIGGPDGFDQKYLANAQHIWSLSKLTLPHQLVKVVLIEQIYRAYTLLTNHPYHRN